MKIISTKVIAIVLGAVLLASCQSSSELTQSSILKKRRYTQGYQWNLKTPMANKAPKARASKTTESQRLKPMTEDGQQTVPISLSASADSKELKIPEATTNKSPDTWMGSKESDPAHPISPMEESTGVTRTGKNDAKGNTQSFNPFGDATVVSTPAVTPSPSGESMVLYVILAILIPPLAVGLLYGIGPEFWISLLLTLLFFIPGMIYSIVMVLSY